MDGFVRIMCKAAKKGSRLVRETGDYRYRKPRQEEDEFVDELVRDVLPRCLSACSLEEQTSIKVQRQHSVKRRDERIMDLEKRRTRFADFSSRGPAVFHLCVWCRSRFPCVRSHRLLITEVTECSQRRFVN